MDTAMTWDTATHRHTTRCMWAGPVAQDVRRRHNMQPATARLDARRARLARLLSRLPRCRIAVEESTLLYFKIFRLCSID